jgi:hypothetical protein
VEVATEMPLASQLGQVQASALVLMGSLAMARNVTRSMLALQQMHAALMQSVRRLDQVPTTACAMPVMKAMVKFVK